MNMTPQGKKNLNTHTKDRRTQDTHRRQRHKDTHRGQRDTRTRTQRTQGHTRTVLLIIHIGFMCFDAISVSTVHQMKTQTFGIFLLYSWINETSLTVMIYFSIISTQTWLCLLRHSASVHTVTTVTWLYVDTGVNWNAANFGSAALYMCCVV